MSDWEKLEFDAWSDNIKKIIREHLSQLKPTRAKKPEELFFLPFEEVDGDLETILEALKEWCEVTAEHCQRFIRDKVINARPKYMKYHFSIIVESREVWLWVSMENMIDRAVNYNMGDGNCKIIRRNKNQFEMFATNEEGRKQGWEDAYRFATTPWEELEATGEVAPLTNYGSFRTEGEPGAVYYEIEKAKTSGD